MSNSIGCLNINLVMLGHDINFSSILPPSGFLCRLVVAFIQEIKVAFEKDQIPVKKDFLNESTTLGKVISKKSFK